MLELIENIRDLTAGTHTNGTERIKLVHQAATELFNNILDAHYQDENISEVWEEEHTREWNHLFHVLNDEESPISQVDYLKLLSSTAIIMELKSVEIKALIASNKYYRNEERRHQAEVTASLGW